MSTSPAAPPAAKADDPPPVPTLPVLAGKESEENALRATAKSLGMQLESYKKDAAGIILAKIRVGAGGAVEGEAASSLPSSSPVNPPSAATVIGSSSSSSSLGGHVFYLHKKGGDVKRGNYSISTDEDFLLNKLFVENLSEILEGATSEAVLLKAAREVYWCIVNEDEDQDGEDDDAEWDGEEYVYDDGEGGMMGEAVGASGSGSGEGGEGDATMDHFHVEKEATCIKAVAKACAAGTANQRLMRDLGRLMRTDTQKMGFSLEPKNEDCMNIWKVNLFGFGDCALAKDLEKLKKDKGQDFVELEMTYKADYPYSPPFVRIVSPRIAPKTGYVIDGALCMELLTKQGWTPTNDIESVMVQLRAQLIIGQARIDFSTTEPYREASSVSAFKRAAAFHKWEI